MDMVVKIPCCVVNDHCDILPFVCACIRANKLSTEALMVHFDAHPDLSVPTPAALEYDTVQAWNSPGDIYYDVLSSEGSISEFLLPMMYQRWLATVLWVRSPWCDQIRDGQYNFRCGNVNVKEQARVPTSNNHDHDHDHDYGHDQIRRE